MTHPMYRRDCSHMLPVADPAQHTLVRSSTMLLLNEELARARSRQLQREAAESVLARRAVDARREQRRSNQVAAAPRRWSVNRARLVRNAAR